MLPGKAGLELKMLYQIRARFLYKLTPIFHMGQESKEIRCMEHLRNLVVGELYSFSHSEDTYADPPQNRMQTSLSAARPRSHPRTFANSVASY